jgi:hypothetical protein
LNESVRIISGFTQFHNSNCSVGYKMKKKRCCSVNYILSKNVMSSGNSIIHRRVSMLMAGIYRRTVEERRTNWDLLKFNENTEAILREHLSEQALQIQPTE